MDEHTRVKSQGHLIADYMSNFVIGKNLIGGAGSGNPSRVESTENK